MALVVHWRACRAAYRFMPGPTRRMRCGIGTPGSSGRGTGGSVCAEDLVVAYLAASDAHIDQLFVDPDHQRTGLGSALLAAMLDRQLRPANCTCSRRTDLPVRSMKVRLSTDGRLVGYARPGAQPPLQARIVLSSPRRSTAPGNRWCLTSTIGISALGQPALRAHRQRVPGRFRVAKAMRIRNCGRLMRSAAGWGKDLVRRGQSTPRQPAGGPAGAGFGDQFTRRPKVLPAAATGGASAGSCSGARAVSASTSRTRSLSTRTSR